VGLAGHPGRIQRYPPPPPGTRAARAGAGAGRRPQGLRRFSEQSNETAGEHFTPREVIRLMVNLLFAEDDEALRKRGVIRTLYDPACGTGGMLSVAENYLRELNRSATLAVYGQELNPESYAICKSDMLIKGEDAANIKFGNSFTQDGLAGTQFDYFLSNPPFGVEWKKVEQAIRDEHEKLGMSGRFGAGLPRINDGSLLFLQHMVSKFKQGGQGSRLAIVFNGSPLFTGGAGSGESEIRRWLIENDWLEAIVALPEQLFYNTPIATYVWVVTNRKSPERRGKVQLVNAVSFFIKMRKSLGDKRSEIGDGSNGKPDQIAEITRIYGEFKPGPFCQLFDNEDFGREVRPHVPDAWVDESKTKKGYEMPFTRYFYEYKPLRPLEQIEAEIMALEGEIQRMLKGAMT
jgi:type I restriction enzyme M protein